MMHSAQTLPRTRYGSGADRSHRPLAGEVAVALSYNGSTQAVMMATPADLIDFAYGFSLTDGAAAPAQISSVQVQHTDLGIDLQIWVEDVAQAQLSARRRSMAGPVGCGLCGIDSLEQALRKPRAVADSAFGMTPPQIMAAMADLPKHQPLHDETRAIHAAGFWAGSILAVREDVGRHNALDKLIGHVMRANILPAGAVLLTSRVSLDMVQKVAALGAPMIIAVSAPTAMACQMAQEAGITLIANASATGFDAFTHPHRIAKDSADAGP